MSLKKSIILAGMLFSGSSFAGGYGPAGCGIGTMLLGDDATGVMGGLAQYLNVGFWGPTSITLGLFNCGDNTIAILDSNTQDYVAANLDQLTEDQAKQNDDGFVALSDSLQCANQTAFISTIQDNENVFYGSDDIIFNNIATIASETCNEVL